MPYFLYSGLHVTKDLPEEMETAGKRHPSVKMTLAKSLGFHDKLVEITLERIRELNSPKPAVTGFIQHPIEKESFRLIGQELGETGFSASELNIVKRVIHTTADFDFKDTLRFSPGALNAGITAVKNGANIVTDVKMVEAGISKERLSNFGSGRVICFSRANCSSEKTAGAGALTLTALAMQKAAPYINGAIVVIGNAPTALIELLRLAEKGLVKPALVIGVPVGFVGAVEAKQELFNSGFAYITCLGRKGGSTVAVAVANGVVIEALGGIQAG
jgi:precorrin-8X/cobalt-precorrin-8 methylmutase